MKYGDISLVLCISTRLRLVTILSLLVKYLVIFHADPCNKSYIYIYICDRAWEKGPCRAFKKNRVITRNVLLSAQMGERASVVLICIITSRFEL